MMNANSLAKLAAVLGIAVFAILPTAGLPAFYDSFFYLVFFWVSLATSWALLSGFAGYFSLGHAAFFGVGMYTTATLTTKFGVPFLATVPAAAAIAALLGVGIGAIVFRLRRLRGELFALLTLAVTFVIATIILNTPIDGGAGVFMSAVPMPNIMPTQTGTIYVLGFADVRADARHRLEGGALATRHGALRHPRRRGRGRSQGRADLPLQDHRLCTVGRHRRRGRRHPCHVCRLPDGGRHVRAHRAALRRADERARRLASLAGAGDRCRLHHDACSMPSSAAARP